MIRLAINQRKQGRRAPKKRVPPRGASSTRGAIDNLENVGLSKTIIIPKSLGFTSPRLRTNLRFSKDVTVSNVGAFSANLYFTPTFAYDVDPLIGSTAMPGFNEWTTLYTRYVVLSSHIKVDFMNNEAFPAMVFITPTNLVVAANTTLANVRQLMAQPVSRQSKVGPLTGNGITTIQHSFTTDMFGGTPDVRLDEQYGGTGTASPVNNWNWNIGIVSGLAGTVAGQLIHVIMDICIEFYEIANLAQ